MPSGKDDMLIDQIRINVMVPRDLDLKECEALNRTLKSKRFLSGLAGVIRAHFKKFPICKHATFFLSQ